MQTEARKQIEAAGQPRCAYCDETDGLRSLHDGGGYIEPDYVCEACFTPQDDGPCFDDLPAA